MRREGGFDRIYKTSDLEPYYVAEGGGRREGEEEKGDTHTVTRAAGGAAAAAVAIPTLTVITSHPCYLLPPTLIPTVSYPQAPLLHSLS